PPRALSFPSPRPPASACCCWGATVPFPCCCCSPIPDGWCGPPSPALCSCTASGNGGALTAARAGGCGSMGIASPCSPPGGIPCPWLVASPICRPGCWCCVSSGTAGAATWCCSGTATSPSNGGSCSALPGTWAAGRGSGMADDDVLGGEIDGHQDGVLGDGGLFGVIEGVVQAAALLALLGGADDQLGHQGEVAQLDQVAADLVVAVVLVDLPHQHLDAVLRPLQALAGPHDAHVVPHE